MGALSNTNAHLLFTISWYDFRLEPFLLHGQQRWSVNFRPFHYVSALLFLAAGVRVCMCVVSQVKIPF